MLDRIVRIVELGSDRPDIRSFADAQHFRNPVRGNGAVHVIVQEKKIFSRGRSHAEIVDGGIIEASVIDRDADISFLLQFFIEAPGLLFGASVLHDDDFNLFIGNVPQGIQAFFQDIRMVPVRNDDRNERLRRQPVMHAVETVVFQNFSRPRKSQSLQRILDGFLPCLIGVDLAHRIVRR